MSDKKEKKMALCDCCSEEVPEEEIGECKVCGTDCLCKVCRDHGVHEDMINDWK